MNEVWLFFVYFGLSTLVIQVLSQCPQNWREWNNKCYYIDRTPITFFQNQRLCKELNAEMVSIGSAEENAFIEQELAGDGRWYWISLRRVGTGVNLFQWGNGEPLKYSSWRPGQPNNIHRQFDSCVYTQDGRWGDRNCESFVNAMCQKVIQKNINGGLKERVDHISKVINQLWKVLGDRINKSVSDNSHLSNQFEKMSSEIKSLTQLNKKQESDISQLIAIVFRLTDTSERQFDLIRNITTETLNSLSENTTSTNGEEKAEFTESPAVYNCYNETNKCYASFRKRKTFAEAVRSCEATGDKLVSMDNTAENTLVTRNAMVDTSYWIGVMRVIRGSPYFTNINGRNFVYSNWASSEPKSTDSDNCVRLYNGNWFVDDCDEEYSYMCEFPYNQKKASNSGNGATVVDRHSKQIRRLLDIIEQVESRNEVMRTRTRKQIEFLNSLSQLPKGEFDAVLSDVDFSTSESDTSRKAPNKRIRFRG